MLRFKICALRQHISFLSGFLSKGGAGIDKGPPLTYGLSMARFLETYENVSCRSLFLSCFPDEGFAAEYYGEGGEALRALTAAAERDGRIVSMAQLLRREAVYEDGSMPVWYIAGVCTEPSYRHRGLMDEVMGLILERLRREGENWCFLLPVDLGIYRHLGFVHDFELRDEDSLELLYADEGLYVCSACELSSGSFRAPRAIRRLE